MGSSQSKITNSFRQDSEEKLEIDIFFGGAFWPIGIKILHNLDTRTLIKCKYVSKKWLHFIESLIYCWRKEFELLEKLQDFDTIGTFNRRLICGLRKLFYEMCEEKRRCSNIRKIALAIKSKCLDINAGHYESYTDRNGQTALHIAMTLQNIELVHYLLQHTNIDPTEADYHGTTPMQVAAQIKFIKGWKMVFLHLFNPQQSRREDQIVKILDTVMSLNMFVLLCFTACSFFVVCLPKLKSICDG